MSITYRTLRKDKRGGGATLKILVITLRSLRPFRLYI